MSATFPVQWTTIFSFWAIHIDTDETVVFCPRTLHHAVSGFEPPTTTSSLTQAWIRSKKSVASRHIRMVTTVSIGQMKTLIQHVSTAVGMWLPGSSLTQACMNWNKCLEIPPEGSPLSRSGEQMALTWCQDATPYQRSGGFTQGWW